ncbi:MAG: N-acetylneuraminate synthase family protein [bacterium]|nr:N-acetylneuraminate synthase family protein [bacterium]
MTMDYRSLTIATSRIGDACPVYVIAEIGINHNGNLDLAMEMVRRSAAAGADAVKFQLVDAARDYAPGTPSYELFRHIALPPGAWERIARAAADVHISVFASFAMPEDIATIRALGFPAIKISSGNLTNLPLLRAAATSGLPLIISTAMSTQEEVAWTVRTVEEAGCRQLAILHCTARYPLPPEDANLRVITTLRDVFPYPVGYSDHSIGATCAIAAVALGAQIIEKHVTLDRALSGPDHHFSATMEEFADLIRAVRATEAALGSGVKVPVTAEVPLRAQYRRTIVAARDLPAGTTLTPDVVTAKRAATPGIDAREYDTLLGRRLVRAVAKDAPVTADAIAVV